MRNTGLEEAQAGIKIAGRNIDNLRYKDDTTLMAEYEEEQKSWCSGRTWRERVEREVGGGIGMGKTCKLKDVSFQCMTKFTTN